MPTIDPLKIDKYLGSVRNRIHLVGIELEGAWQSLPNGCNPGGDGSVRFEKEQSAGLRFERIGEFASEPMAPVAIPRWVKRFYPSHVNETCGLHVHMSFKRALHYQWLMAPEYQETIFYYLAQWASEEELEKNHPIWKRLKGDSTYCKRAYYANVQVSKMNKSYSHGEGDRYTAINYPHNLHGTIECRLLPMMKTAEQAVKGIYKVLDITNASLAMLAAKEKVESGQVEAKGESWQEERKVIV